MNGRLRIYLVMMLGAIACSKHGPEPIVPPPPPAALSLVQAQLNGTTVTGGSVLYNVAVTPAIQLKFSTPVNRTAVTAAITLRETAANDLATTVTFANSDSTVVVQPAAPLKHITRYTVSVGSQLTSAAGSALQNPSEAQFVTTIDSTDKFPRVSDNELLDIVQRQTFKYFWDFAHPVSGLARERNTSGDVVTTGGSGFGIMSIVTAVDRHFITRQEGLQRMQKIVTFLQTKAARFHGVFPHWLNGTTGAVVPFSEKDDAADLVETSFLVQGLLTARQYFNGGDAAEAALRTGINEIWQQVDWNWFRQGDQNVLYWHWSPKYDWQMNVKLTGWNEALIAYVLAASAPVNPIPKTVYDNGWANNGAIKNGNSYYGVTLPLGPSQGGPLFFEHYSFLGLDPNGLTDAYTAYQTQTKNHTLINYNYCVANPRGFFGYSNQCWGLTASDDFKSGYLAHSPSNDNGVISPTAAISSLPYTPAESMQALRFFYYQLGDKIFKEYGFTDAFSLTDTWFANSFLAIDQGPIIVMIENHRSKLLWNLFMSCPEVKSGLVRLGFQSPHL